MTSCTLGAQIGVERVIVSGRVRVFLKPLLDSMPIIGAVQVCSPTFWVQDLNHAPS